MTPKTAPPTKPSRRPMVNPYRRKSPTRSTFLPLRPRVTPEKRQRQPRLVSSHNSDSSITQTLSSDSEYPDIHPAFFAMATHKDQLLHKIGQIATNQGLSPLLAADIVNLLQAWQALGATTPMPITQADLLRAIGVKALPAAQTQNTTPPPAGTTPEAPVDPEPILSPTDYMENSNEKSTPHDSVQDFLHHMGANYGYASIQTPLDFNEFSNRHAAVNAIIAGLVAFNAPPSAVKHVIEAAKNSTLPAKYKAQHPNKLVVPTDLQALNLLPAGYSLIPLPNLGWPELLVPRANTVTVTASNINAIAFPIIVESKIGALPHAENPIGMFSEFAVLHTMANALVIGSPRNRAQCKPKVNKPMAFHWFKIGYGLAINIRTQSDPEEFASQKIGSKLVPHWGASEPTQCQTRTGLTVIGAYALIPPNPVPRAPGTKSTRKRGYNSP